MAVKVILQQDVASLGKAGDVKQVTPGYFRNFLQPRGLAVEASKGELATLQVSAKVKNARQAKALTQADALARRLQDTTINIPVKLGAQGRMYGSVTNKDIAQQLASQANIEIDRHKIELREPLKSLGIHSVPIKLEHGVEAHVNVELVPEAEPARA